MSDTILLASEGTCPKTGESVHILGYQNTAISEEPNCMILTIPTRSHITSENMLDMSKYPNLLKDYAKPFLERKTLGVSRSLKSIEKEIFSKGSYTVLLTRDIRLSQVVEELTVEVRPNISPMFDNFLGRHRPPSHFMYGLCCWKGSISPEPLVWWYYPNDYEYLFLPGLDCHDGNPPEFGGQETKRDHTIVIGDSFGYGRLSYLLPLELENLMPKNFIGTKIDRYTTNCDWYYPINRSTDSKSRDRSGSSLENELIPLGGRFLC